MRLGTARTTTCLLTFLLVTLWDYVATIGVRFTAAESLWAVPNAALIAVIWWAVVRMAAKTGWVVGVASVLGAVVGTWLGINWP